MFIGQHKALEKNLERWFKRTRQNGSDHLSILINGSCLGRFWLRFLHTSNCFQFNKTLSRTIVNHWLHYCGTLFLICDTFYVRIWSTQGSLWSEIRFEEVEKQICSSESMCTVIMCFMLVYVIMEGPFISSINCFRFGELA